MNKKKLTVRMNYERTKNKKHETFIFHNHNEQNFKLKC